MTRKLVILALAMGSSLIVCPGPSTAQDVQFFEHPPTKDELLKTLTPKSPPPPPQPVFERKPGSRGIGMTEAQSTAKPQCAHYRKQASRGIQLKPDSDIAAFMVTFAYNSAELTNDAKQTLDTLGETLKTDQLAVCCFQIEGHTDSKGTDAYNQKLSERRAHSVVNYLTQRLGVEKDRMLAVGYGKSKPIAENDTDEGRQKNRRVQIANLGYGK